MRIAVRLGRTPRELLASCDSAELTRLIAFDRVEASGEYRLLYQMAAVAATIANCHRTKHQRAFEPKDFLVVPYDRGAPEPRRKLWSRMVAAFGALTGGRNGRQT